RRLACPRDISVVGHNDMPLVDMVAPPLTTVRIGHREMGHEAAQLLMRAINRDAGARLNIVLSPTLMIRKSTAAPR
ncbi:substrate-binding domain-containing protein, partial [Acinetobacter baumannii]